MDGNTVEQPWNLNDISKVRLMTFMSTISMDTMLMMDTMSHDCGSGSVTVAVALE